MEKKISSCFVYKFLTISIILYIYILPLHSGEIDDINKWAWSTNAGWINCNTAYGSMEVFDDHLEGYIWAENIGWIRLGTYSGGGSHSYPNTTHENYGVNNDGAGNLSGYAWSTNAGWIDFDTAFGRVIIDGLTGEFTGYAWSENVGWISFSGDFQSRADYFVLTDWRDPSVPVTLSSFTAAYTGGTSVLHWTTATETGNLGWNLYRAMSDNIEESLLINPNLIPGAGTTSEPTEYSYQDPDDLIQNTEYWYWLENMDVSGETNTFGPISLVIPEDGEDPEVPEVPVPYGLHQNYPNPFNPETSISFLMEQDCRGKLNVYNIKGQMIRTLFQDLDIRAEEVNTVSWDGKNDLGKDVMTGIYYYKLETNKGSYIRKMMLLK